MGDYVYGSGEVTLKKELSAVNFSQMQEGLKKKKDDLDMVELTFRIRLDATNKSSIMEITETWKKQDDWIIPSSETQIKPMSKDNHEQIFTIEDVLSVTGGNTKAKLVGYEGEIEHCVWTGIVDDYNFEYAPYGHHKAIHISVTNKDISQDDNDVLYIYFNYPELTEENKKEIEELKKYFYFCGFPEGGVEQLYYRYGKNTEDYIRNHSMGKLFDNIKSVN